MGFSFGLSGDSKSSTKKNTTLTDSRIANQSGSATSVNLNNAVFRDVGGVSLKLTDHGAVDKALKSNSTTTTQVLKSNESILTKAINAVSKADATQNEGYEKLLSTTKSMFDNAASLIKSSSESALAGVNAVMTSKNDASGQLDQKTILIVAAAIVAGLWAIKKG